MREAAYSYIDYCMLWISVFQLVLSIAGMVGIVYSILSYRQAVKNQIESEHLTRDTIDSLKNLIQLQIKSHELDNISIRIQSKPIFIDHRRTKQDESTVYVVLINDGQPASNLSVKIINNNIWSLKDENSLKTTVLNSQELHISLYNIQTSQFPKNQLNMINSITASSSFEFELHFEDSIKNKCMQLVSGNSYHIKVSDVEYL